MAEIRHYLLIDAPLEKVYEAVTTQAGLAAWWTGQTLAEPAVDAIIEFRFGEQYHNKMRVTGLAGDHRFLRQLQLPLGLLPAQPQTFVRNRRRPPVQRGVTGGPASPGTGAEETRKEADG